MSKGLGEFERAEEIIGIGQGQCRHALLGRERGKPRNGQRSFQQRISRVHPQMHEGLRSLRQDQLRYDSLLQSH